MTTAIDKKILQALDSLELSTREVQVYVTCLNSGEATVQELASKTGIRRTTLYSVLERLHEKGIIGFFQHRAHRVFFAEHPEKLLLTATRERQEAELRHAAVKEAIPSLLMQYNQGSYKPSVHFYQGQEDLRIIAEDILNKNVGEVLTVCHIASVERAFGADYLRDYVKRRIASGIRLRTIYTADSEIPHSLYKGGSERLRALRIAPPEFSAPVYTGIYDDKVFLISADKEMYGILITSRAYADTMRHWFEVLWGASHAVPRTKKGLSGLF